MTKRDIKFVCQVVKWFDKVNGNSYHSVRVTKTSNGKTVVPKIPYDYGYGEAYKQTALKLMADVKWLLPKYRDAGKRYLYEMGNNYPIMWIVSDGLKKEMIQNGTL